MLPRLVVLVSGDGTNLQAILDATTDGRLTASVALVVSNRASAYGLIRARRAGIPTLCFPLRPFVESGAGRLAYDCALAERISPYAPDLIVLAGWMHVLSPCFLDRFSGLVINLHPALPRTFAGIGAIRRAYEARRGDVAVRCGCMVHFATDEVDGGPVIATLEVPLHDGDTFASFEERMHLAEHWLVVHSIRTVLEGRGTTAAR